ncbi:hypothetical protein HN419_05560 [Candidatus Woesearchaeota archaeon]|jgi:hypothetical protein|nr:hypothetical protein [Candidatus Woesearchaeota archaeon]MBT3537664.1 hypothetical protein [Candidatus Woesearchaeota archaeon]MBT4698249.1 hypothetical protein [Candidatus Woesearchaeota archaeon]MBT7105333.1 hypothetical protein [Candidatus Woesearchaeota archaeon]MBT7931524.1 hypothetical protein [Candidatus Woesearchaeota archaeon]
MYLKGVYKQNLAIFMCFLVISLSFASARSFAQPVSPPADYAVEIVHISGENGVNGYAKPTDEVSVAALVKTNEQSLDENRVLFNGYPADSCNPFGSDRYKCEIEFKIPSGNLEVIYKNEDYSVVAQASASITIDDVSPLVEDFSWDESAKRLNFRVSDTSRVNGYCSGINQISLFYGDLFVSATPTIKSQTSCTTTGYFDMKSFPGELIGDAILSVSDKLDNYVDSSSLTVTLDNLEPVIKDILFETAGVLGEELFVNPGNSYNAKLTVSYSDLSISNVNLGDSVIDVVSFIQDGLPPSDHARFASLEPQSCSLSGDNTATCIWQFPMIVSTSSTRIAKIKVGDGAGNYVTKTHEVNFQADSSKPIVKKFLSNSPVIEGGYVQNFVGGKENKFELILEESGAGLNNGDVYLDMSSIRVGHQKTKANSCKTTNGSTTWSCIWEPIWVNRPDIVSSDVVTIRLHSSFDDAQNRISNQQFRVTFDNEPPVIKRTNYTINSFRDCPTSNDVVTYRVLVEDTSPVTKIEINGAIDEHNRIVDVNEPFVGVCRPYKHYDGLYECNVNLSNIVSFPVPSAEIELTAYDAAGNFDSIRKVVTICGINNTGVPNCVYLNKGRVTPSVVDWRAASVKPFPLYVELMPISLDPNCKIYETVLATDIKIHSLMHSGILTDVELHKGTTSCFNSEFPVTEAQILNGKADVPILSLRLGGMGAEAVNSSDLPPCEDSETDTSSCFNPVKPKLSCNIGFVVRDGLVFYEKIELETVNFTAPLANLPIGYFDEAFGELVDGVKSDLRGVDEKIDQIIIWAEYIRYACEYLQYAILMTTIVTILTTVAFIIFSPIIKACPKTSQCAFIGTALSGLLDIFTEVSTSALKVSSYLWNYLPTEQEELYHITGWLARATCLINTCHLCSIGDGSGASKPEGFFKAMGIMASLTAGLQMAGADTYDLTESVADSMDLGGWVGEEAANEIVNTLASTNTLVDSLISNGIASAIQGAIETSDAYAGTNIEPGFNAMLGTAALTGGAGVAAGAATGTVAAAGMAGAQAGMVAGGLSLDDNLEMNPYKSREVAEGCFCYPGQLAAERKRKQILCKEYKCLQDIGRYGTLPANVCTEMRSIRECLYYHGAIVEIGLPSVWLIIQTILAAALKLLFPPSYLTSRVLQWITQKIMELPALKNMKGSALTEWITVPSYDGYAKYAALLMYDYGELSTPMEGSEYMDKIMGTMSENCNGVEYDD